ncbi:TetR/AcrR family transcriptional regulator [Croceivirga radicis]|uniref:TetR/AcrR family transcriptional regulator n=1 Tax=Croceivirga radicis TaxID=1929488 RepID=UPI002934CEA4|nr:helix-turn-helix domain-containing protein [Croceivirga radicis]
MNKKQIILSSALELLVEKGVHNTPMSAIGKAAKTGMGTIYNYFPNKEALINEIYTDIKKKKNYSLRILNRINPSILNLKTILLLL